MVILVFISALVLILLAGYLCQVTGSARDRRNSPPPGQLIDIGDGRLHVLDSAKGNPAVILESGIAASSLNWTSLWTQLSQSMRVVSYDRAGFGWSARRESPRTLSRIVAELDELLTRAGIPAPFILVGHSFGGLIVSAYAIRFPERVGGLVLIDPLGASEWRDASAAQLKTLRRGVKLARRGALLAKFGVVRGALALLAGGARGIPKLVARATSGSGESVISRIAGEVRKMPPETWPLVRAHWCQPQCFLAMADYLEMLPANSGEAARLGELPERIPVTILSAVNSSPAHLRERDAVARHSERGKHITVENSGHWVHLDQPRIVAREICEMAEFFETSAGPGHSKR